MGQVSLINLFVPCISRLDLKKTLNMPFLVYFGADIGILLDGQISLPHQLGDLQFSLTIQEL